MVLPQLLLWCSLLYLLQTEVVHDIEIKITHISNPPPKKAGFFWPILNTSRREGLSKTQKAERKPNYKRLKASPPVGGRFGGA